MKRVLFGLFYFLSSCQGQNFSNIYVSGKILDSATGKPIANANVVLLCWYAYGIDEATYEKKELTSNVKGEFKATFEKGYQIDCAALFEGYNPARSYNELSLNSSSIRLSLQKASVNSSLIYKDNRNIAAFDTTASRLFLGIRIYPQKGSDKLDFKTATSFGYDLKTFRMSSSLNNCDFWFQAVNKDEQPKTVIAHRNGGLIPIFEKEIKSSALFEKSTAPDSGYQNNYTLTGKETGFFIKCRDGLTYAKIIFEKAEISAGISNMQGSYYQELGRNFTLLYQTNGTRDLSYSNSNIDLVDFLVDFRLM